MKQIILVVILATATGTFARLGNTRKDFEQAHPDFKYVGESPGSEPNTVVRQYARDGTLAQIAFGADGKIIMEAFSDLSGKVPESSLVPVAKTYGYDFSALQKISVSGPWKALVLHRDFWFSVDHKFCIGIGDVVMNDSQVVSTMTVAGEQVAPDLYQNSTKKGSAEPAKTSATMNLLKALIFVPIILVEVFWAWHLAMYALNVVSLPGILAAWGTDHTRIRYWVGSLIAFVAQAYFYLAVVLVFVLFTRRVAAEAGWIAWPLGFVSAILPLYFTAGVAAVEDTGQNPAVPPLLFTEIASVIGFILFAFLPNLGLMGWPWLLPVLENVLEPT